MRFISDSKFARCRTPTLQLVEFFYGELGLFEELLQKADAEFAVLRDGKCVEVIGFDHHDMGANLPVKRPSCPAEFLYGFRAGAEVQLNSQG